jgi:hypothetical protein
MSLKYRDILLNCSKIGAGVLTNGFSSASRMGLLTEGDDMDDYFNRIDWIVVLDPFGRRKTQRVFPTSCRRGLLIKKSNKSDTLINII